MFKSSSLHFHGDLDSLSICFSLLHLHTLPLCQLFLPLPLNPLPAKCSPIKTQKENKKPRSKCAAASSLASPYKILPCVSSSSTETGFHEVTSEWHLCCSAHFQSSYGFVWSMWQLPPSLATMLCLLVLSHISGYSIPLFIQRTHTEHLLPVGDRNSSAPCPY